MVETVRFSTLLRPHRSLSANGFKWLIRVLLLANLLVALPMYFLGAWPVAGFCGLDVALSGTCSTGTISTPGAARR